MNEQRLSLLRKKLKENYLDAFILFNKEYNNRPNVQYLSAFTGSYCILLITLKEQFIISDARYFDQVKEESEFILIKQMNKNPWPHLDKIFKNKNIENLGFASNTLNVNNFLELKKKNIKLKGFDRLIMKMRSVKDENEIKLIKTACEIASDAFGKFYKRIKIGMKESDLAAELTYEMRKLGAEKPVKGHFVVASGKRGQRPHGVFTDKKIEDGDMITFDFGVVYKGYVSDITRTVGIGNVSKKMKEIYQIVLEAQKKTISLASSKYTGESLDSVARTYIEEKDYGEYFTHSTGHGIGLEIHELPMVNQRNPEILAENSVVTVEPGIYIPDLGGVRIEDDIVIKNDGCEVLSSARKDLVIVDA